MTTARVKDYLKTCDLTGAVLDRCASSLCISVSVISRRLKADGVTFTSLLDAERRARCEALYSRHKRPDAALVMRVTGYRSTSSVTRAIRRWFGANLLELRS